MPLLTAEFDALNQRHGSLLRVDVVSLSLVVEESDLAYISFCTSQTQSSTHIPSWSKS
jgi:hypothetical protein